MLQPRVYLAQPIYTPTRREISLALGMPLFTKHYIILVPINYYGKQSILAYKVKARSATPLGQSTLLCV